MSKLNLSCLFSLVFFTLTSVVFAEESPASKASKVDVLTLETATLRGNQELPTVLYLVPWQPPKVQSLQADQTENLLTLTIQPIDRTSFQRRIEYHQIYK